MTLICPEKTMETIPDAETNTHNEATYSLSVPPHLTSTYHLDMKLQLWM